MYEEYSDETGNSEINAYVLHYNATVGDLL